MLKILEFIFSGFWTFSGVAFLIALIGNDIAAIVSLFLNYLKEKNKADLDFQKSMWGKSRDIQNKIFTDLNKELEN